MAKVTREIEDTHYLWVDYRMKILSKDKWKQSLLYTPKRGKALPYRPAKCDTGMWRNNLIGIRVI